MIPTPIATYTSSSCSGLWPDGISHIDVFAYLSFCTNYSLAELSIFHPARCHAYPTSRWCASSTSWLLSLYKHLNSWLPAASYIQSPDFDQSHENHPMVQYSQHFKLAKPTQETGTEIMKVNTFFDASMVSAGFNAPMLSHYPEVVRPLWNPLKCHATEASTQWHSD